MFPAPFEVAMSPEGATEGDEPPPVTVPITRTEMSPFAEVRLTPAYPRAVLMTPPLPIVRLSGPPIVLALMPSSEVPVIEPVPVVMVTTPSAAGSGRACVDSPRTADRAGSRGDGYGTTIRIPTLSPTEPFCVLVLLRLPAPE